MGRFSIDEYTTVVALGEKDQNRTPVVRSTKKQFEYVLCDMLKMDLRTDAFNWEIKAKALVENGERLFKVFHLRQK